MARLRDERGRFLPSGASGASSSGTGVDVDLSQLEDIAKGVTQGGRHYPGPIAVAFKQWAFRYRAFADARFEEHKSGGGEDPWQELHPSTIARRKNKDKDNISILWDTGVLMGALSPTFTGAKGALEDDIPFGIRVGYGGPHRANGESNLTIADIAEVHQEGLGNVPQREIIVKPPQGVIDKMAGDMQRAINKVRDG